MARTDRVAPHPTPYTPKNETPKIVYHTARGGLIDPVQVVVWDKEDGRTSEPLPAYACDQCGNSKTSDCNLESLAQVVRKD